MTENATNELVDELSDEINDIHMDADANAAEKKRLTNKRKKDKLKAKKKEKAALEAAYVASAEEEKLGQTFNTLPMRDYFVSPISLVHSRRRGRHAVTTMHVQAGQQAFSCLPYASVVSDQYVKMLCHRCFKHDKSRMLECDTCHFAHYCSVSCKNLSSSIHAVECKPIIEFSKRSFDGDSSSIRLLLRMLIQRHVERNAIKSYTDKHKKPPSSKLSLSSTDAWSLQTHIDAIDAQQRLQIASVISALGDILRPFYTDLEDVIRTYLIIHINAHGVMFNKQRIGIGLYVPASLLNHSCMPSCVYYVDQQELTMRIIRDMSAGEELTYPYCDLYSPRASRQAVLKAVYHIEQCDCERCKEPIDSSFDRYLDAWQCNECKKGILKVTRDETGKIVSSQCSQCRGRVSATSLESCNQQAQIAFDQAVSLNQQNLNDDAFDLLTNKLLSPLSDTNDARPHPHSAIAFNAYLVLIGIGVQLKKFDLSSHYAGLTITCMKLAKLFNHPELADSFVARAEATLELASQRAASIESTDSQPSLFSGSPIELFASARSDLKEALAIRNIVFGERHMLVRDVERRLQSLISQERTLAA